VSRRRSAISHRSRGIALVVVLWLVALLALMAVSQTAAVRTDTQIIGNLVESANARAAAYAGLQLAIVDVAKPLSAREMSPDGSLYALHFDSAALFIAISDEGGKVDINVAPAPLLDALLKASGVEEGRRAALVAAILDWRDKDTLRRLNGAEEEDYRAAGLDYGPRNGPFQSLEELALVLGFDAQLYYAFADSLTIYSGSATTNMAVATPLVLQALHGGSEDGSDTLSDSTYTVDEPATDATSGFRGTGGSNVFSIYVEARLDSGVRERLEAVVRLLPSRANTPLRYELLRWREGVAPRLPPGT
jgi:general secretion pathway protein K